SEARTARPPLRFTKRLSPPRPFHRYDDSGAWSRARACAAWCGCGRGAEPRATVGQHAHCIAVCLGDLRRLAGLEDEVLGVSQWALAVDDIPYRVASQEEIVAHN